MKKLFYAVLASAAVVLSIESCQKNEIVQEYNLTEGLVFSSEKPELIDETKTAWTGETIKWSKGDAIRVAYTCDDVWQNADGTATKDETTGSKTAKTYQSTSLSADAETAKFSVPGDFKGTVAGTYVFYGAYPASACTDGSNFKYAPSLTVTIPESQTPAANSFDSAADFMLGKSVSTYKGIPTEEVSMNWDRMVAHAQLTFKTLNGFTAGETISKVELTADSEADMVGKHYIYLDTKNVNKPDGTVANALTINGTNLSVDETGTFVAWASFLPCTVKSLTVVVTTNKATYTREIASCELVFKKNAKNTLAINMSEADRKLISQSLNVNFPDLGYKSWGENASFSGNTKAVVSQTVSNVRLEYKRNGSNLYANTTAIRFYKSNTLTFVSPDGYYITDIQWTGSNYKNDVTTNVGTCSSSNEALSWTGNAETVTFTRPNNATDYITLSSVTVSLAKDSRTPLATPTVTATLDENVTNSIIVSWNSVENAGSYVVTAKPSTGASVSETVNTTSCTITGLAYETEYTISVVAKPSDTSLYLDSAAGEAGPVTTGAKPAGGGVTPTEVTFDFTKISDFSGWDSSYTKHTVVYDEGVVTFASANKNSSTITDQPVSKGGALTLVMNNSQTINSLEFTCTKWGTKAQTITLNTSTDGGNTWTKTTNTSSNFVLTVASLPEGVNAIKFTFSSSSNQIGYKSLKINYNKN